MEEKQKQRKIDLKFIILCVLLIVCLVGAIICFVHQDKLNMRPNVSTNKSDINLVDDELDLNTSFTLDENGNYVSQNLLQQNLSNLDIHSNSSQINNVSNYSITYTINEDNSNSTGVYFLFSRNFTINNIYSFSFDLTATSNITLVVYGMENNVITDDELTTYKHFSSTFDLNNQAYIIYTKGSIGTQVKLSNLMLNEGATPLPFEPYGLWYSQGNYNNYGNVKYNDGYNAGYSQATDDIYSNNPFYNASLKYYAALDSSSPWFTMTLDNSILQNSNTLDVNQVVKSILNENDQYAFYNDHGIGYFKVDFAKSFSASEMVYLVNAANPYQFDHYFTYYFDDGSEYVFHNPIESEYSNYYWQYDVSLANTNKNGQRVVGISFRKGARDIVNSVSQSQYNIGYNDGYSSGYSSGYDSGTGAGYNTGYAEGNKQGYSTGYNDGYEIGFGQTNYLRTTVFAIADTPIRVFKQIFDFNILGINIAGIVLSIMSLFVIIWLVKKVK